MITFKEEFIQRYVDKFNHKLIQELNSALPDKDYFASMIEQANNIIKQLAKEI